MMDFVIKSLDFIRHLDVHLETLMRDYQSASYLILAVTVFCETGLVITPFLPGDSLLFAAGALTAKTKILEIKLLMLVLIVAAFLGDNVNYFLGRCLGVQVFERRSWFLRQSHLERTRAFYQRHGGKAIVLARFLPILRTFAPFVAGVAAMRYPRFIGYSLLASLLWVPIFCLTGYYFGQLPFVKNNFEWIIAAIIAISFAPLAFEWWRHRRRVESRESRVESETT